MGTGMRWNYKISLFNLDGEGDGNGLRLSIRHHILQIISTPPPAESNKKYRSHTRYRKLTRFVFPPTLQNKSQKQWFLFVKKKYVFLNIQFCTVYDQKYINT